MGIPSVGLVQQPAFYHYHLNFFLPFFTGTAACFLSLLLLIFYRYSSLRQSPPSSAPLELSHLSGDEQDGNWSIQFNYDDAITPPPPPPPSLINPPHM